jgi:hypothetical protein
MLNRTYNYNQTDLRFVFAVVFGSFFLTSPNRAQFSVKSFLISSDLILGTTAKFQNEEIKHENVNTSAVSIVTERLLICSHQTLLMVSEMYLILQYSCC